MNEPQKRPSAPSQPLVFQPPSKDFEVHVKTLWRSAFKSSHWIWAIGARFYAVMAGFLALPALVNLVFNGGAI